ncbi:hypothetical protein [Fibrella forsythiae]|uniref:Secreted protein n=1 Tax=Fibrella forsythiae TaxID=2817061 RepID=A0ABS3JJB6_9BACT|nr:hypothetical protein [Fibrella forsythiae]MBO0950090.1 hypothetical protein [Fibrella forsythiae]
MGKTTPTKWQWLTWSSGMIAAWLMILLPVWNAEASSETEQKTYISCDSPAPSAPNPDYASMVCSHGPVARISAQTGFAFGPSLNATTCWLPACQWVAATCVPGQLYRSSYSFRFLQLIFEHQIAINAP